MFNKCERDRALIIGISIDSERNHHATRPRWHPPHPLDRSSHLRVGGKKLSKRSRSRLDNRLHRHRYLSRMDCPDEKVDVKNTSNIEKTNVIYSLLSGYCMGIPFTLWVIR